LRSVDLAGSHVVCDRKSSPGICGERLLFGTARQELFFCHGNSRNTVLGSCQIIFLSELHVPVARSVLVNDHEILRLVEKNTSNAERRSVGGRFNVRGLSSSVFERERLRGRDWRRKVKQTTCLDVVLRVRV
jgi:hypothetical protein